MYIRRHPFIIRMLFAGIRMFLRINSRLFFPFFASEDLKKVGFDLLFLSVRPLGAIGRVVRKLNADDADLADKRRFIVATELVRRGGLTDDFINALGLRYK